MNRTTCSRKMIVAAMSAIGAAAYGVSAHAAAITAPYTDNYTTYTSGTLPNNVTIADQSGYTPAWSLTTATNSPTNNNGNYSVSLYTATGADGTDSAYQATNVPSSAGTGFSESATMSLSNTSNDYYVGLGALGLTSTLAVASGTSYVFADLHPTNAGMRLYVNENGTQSNTSATLTGASVNTTDTYTETLSGSYTTGGSLNLNFSVFDNTTQLAEGTLSYSVSATGAPNGQYFGLRDNGGSTGSQSETISYTSYSLSAVPEPASLGIVAFAGLGVLSRRRRR